MGASPRRKTRRSGGVLRSGRGYIFKPKGRNAAVLMKDDGGTGPTFKCTCTAGPGGQGTCTVTITGSSIRCSEGTCKGVCGWVITVPGISGTWTRA
jgi:hypothetical protein